MHISRMHVCTQACSHMYIPMLGSMGRYEVGYDSMPELSITIIPKGFTTQLLTIQETGCCLEAPKP